MMSKVKGFLSYDEEMEMYLNGVLDNLRNLGIKNAKKTDALRFIIKMNQQSTLQPIRLNRKKPTIRDGIGFQ